MMIVQVVTRPIPCIRGCYQSVFFPVKDHPVQAFLLAVYGACIVHVSLLVVPTNSRLLFVCKSMALILSLSSL